VYGILFKDGYNVVSHRASQAFPRVLLTLCAEDVRIVFKPPNRQKSRTAKVAPGRLFDLGLV
jgi:hypothetical protein